MDYKEININPSTIEKDALSQIVEALIFAAPEPVSVERIVDIIGNTNSDEILGIIEKLNNEYLIQNRSFHIIRGGGGYRFATLPEYGRWVRKLVVGSGRVRLTRAALETLSLIAYRQPITKAEIEAIRGVDSSHIIRMLLERRLIKINGRKPVAGRPLLYGTTTDFLKHFGLDSLDDLPKQTEVNGKAQPLKESVY